MSVTVRLDRATAEAFDEIVDRVDRTAVWVASEAIIAAARYMPTPVLAPHLGRRPSTERLLLTIDLHTLDVIDGLRVVHTAPGRRAPSRHAIARAAILLMLDEHGGVDGAVSHLGEARPRRNQDRKVG